MAASHRQAPSVASIQSGRCKDQIDASLHRVARLHCAPAGACVCTRCTHSTCTAQRHACTPVGPSTTVHRLHRIRTVSRTRENQNTRFHPRQQPQNQARRVADKNFFPRNSGRHCELTSSLEAESNMKRSRVLGTTGRDLYGVWRRAGRG